MRQTAFGCILLCSVLRLSAQQLTLYTTDYPPLSMVAQGGRVTGIGIELLQLAAQNSGISLDIRGDLSWKRAQQATQQARNACIYPLTRASERERLYQWASLISPGELALFSLNDGPQPANLAAASKLRTVVMLGTTAENRLREQRFNFSTTQTPADSLRMLQHHAVDLWAVHNLVARYHAAQQGIAIKQVLVLNQANSWLACHPALPSSLIQRLDKAITQLHASGEHQHITQRYLQRKTP